MQSPAFGTTPAPVHPLAAPSLRAPQGRWQGRWYHTPQGPRIRRNCFDTLTADPLTLARVETAFEFAKNQVSGCAYRYPELQPYITEWLDDFSTQTITCRDLLFGGGRHILRTKIGHRSFSRFGSSLESDPGLSFGNWSAAVSLLVHEVFHGTSVDASGFMQHWREEQRLVSDNAHLVGQGAQTSRVSCQAPSESYCEEQNMVNDRLSLVTALCMQTGVSSLGGESHLYPAASLFIRSLKCGMNKACGDTFTRGRGTRLSQTQATSLCSRIFEEGQCQVERRQTQEDFHSRTASDFLSQQACSRQNWTGQSALLQTIEYANYCNSGNHSSSSGSWLVPAVTCP